MSPLVGLRRRLGELLGVKVAGLSGGEVNPTLCWRKGWGTRLSYRGTAADFRESLRETLDHLAPDADVEAQAWYKPEDDQKKPTMKQKARYVLTSRQRNKTQRESAEKALRLVDELSGEIMRAVYNRASLATHVHESKAEVQKIRRYVDTLLFDLLEIAP